MSDQICYGYLLLPLLWKRRQHMRVTSVLILSKQSIVVPGNMNDVSVTNQSGPVVPDKQLSVAQATTHLKIMDLAIGINFLILPYAQRVCRWDNLEIWKKYLLNWCMRVFQLQVKIKSPLWLPQRVQREKKSVLI